jgi:hypothetical protein
MSNLKNIKIIAEQASKGASLAEKNETSKTTNKLVRNVPNRLKKEHKELLDNGYTNLTFSKFMIEATAKHLKSFNKN